MACAMAKKKSNYGAIKVQNSDVDIDCFRIHGVDYANYSSESESGKSEFDDDYYIYKPQPIDINKKQIIIVENRKDKGVENKSNHPVRPNFTKTNAGGMIDVLPESGKKIIPIIEKIHNPSKLNTVDIEEKCIGNVNRKQLKPSREENTYKRLNSEIMSNKSESTINNQVHRNTIHKNSPTANVILDLSNTMTSPFYNDHIKSQTFYRKLNFPSPEQYQSNNLMISHQIQTLQPELIERNINRSDPVQNFLSVTEQTDILNATQRNSFINEIINNFRNPNLIVIEEEKKCARNIPRTPTEFSRKEYATTPYSPSIKHLHSEIMSNQSESRKNKQVHRNTTLKNSVIEHNAASEITNRTQNFTSTKQYRGNNLNVSHQIQTLQPESIERNINRNDPVQNFLSVTEQTRNYSEIAGNNPTIIKQQRRTNSSISSATQRHSLINENISNIHETHIQTNLNDDEVSLINTDRGCCSSCTVC